MKSAKINIFNKLFDFQLQQAFGFLEFKIEQFYFFGLGKIRKHIFGFQILPNLFVLIL